MAFEVADASPEQAGQMDALTEQLTIALGNLDQVDGDYVRIFGSISLPVLAAVPFCLGGSPRITQFA